MSLCSHDPICKPHHRASWNPRKTVSQPFQLICKLFQQRASNMKVLGTATGSSPWLQRQTCSLYLHTVVPALGCSRHSLVLHTPVARSDSVSKTFPHPKPGLKPSPVEGAEFGLPGCFFIKLQNRSIQALGNKITPQFSLSSLLHICTEALTQLHSHHLLTPALQLFGPMNLYITILTSGHYTCKIKYSSLILDKN